MSDREGIRLVIWDLDQTYWRGTLTEGGMEYVDDHHQIVIELAKRGIISSICSKNDLAPIQEILQQKGIWDYFILPSIDWTAKGSRLKQLIEQVQLRPETVLFIDDNASNRAEAAAHVPGLQVADETVISTLLTNPLCQGKNDIELSRLKQYQILQKRHTDAASSGLDNTEFLRKSDIRVTIEPNIALHVDRAIELINRTNQLNFTKCRLTSEGEAAKQELIKMADLYYHQAGLVRVQDNYGDYGFCGFYVIAVMHDYRRLVHFCFSCRVLGMGVERWLYQRLGKPGININGQVEADLFSEEKIDWINQACDGALIFADNISGTDSSSSVKTSNRVLIPEIRLRGGCELDALSHYLSQTTNNIVLDTHYVHEPFLIRQDISTNIASAFNQTNERIKNEIDALNLSRGFNDIFKDAKPKTLFVMSVWGDGYLCNYQHKSFPFSVSVSLRSGGLANFIVPPEELETFLATKNYPEDQQNEIRRISRHLSEHYVCIGRVNANLLESNLLKIFKRVPADCLLLVMPPHTHNKARDMAWLLGYHEIVRTVAQQFPQVVVFDITPYITSEYAAQDVSDHLNRMVYFKIYEDIVKLYNQYYQSATRDLPQEENIT